MQVDGRPAQGDLGIGQPAHRRHRAGQVRGGHAGVADHDDVAVEPVPPLAEQVGEVRRAGLLLTLDDQLDGDRRGVPAGGGQVRADAEQVEGDVALVVDGAAGVQLGTVGALDDRRLERRVLPQLQRVDRLHVVVAVDQRDRGALVGGRPLGEDRRRARGRPDLDGREAGAAQRLGQPLGAGGTSAACAGSAEIDGIRNQASRSACRSSRWAVTKSRSALLLTALTVSRPLVPPSAAVDDGGARLPAWPWGCCRWTSAT